MDVCHQSRFLLVFDQDSVLDFVVILMEALSGLLNTKNGRKADLELLTKGTAFSMNFSSKQATSWAEPVCLCSCRSGGTEPEQILSGRAEPSRAEPIRLGSRSVRAHEDDGCCGSLRGRGGGASELPATGSCAPLLML